MNCWHCQSKLIWNSDFSYEDYCIDGDLVEMFLEINEEAKERVVTMLNELSGKTFTSRRITNYIQDIRTKH